jgi:hypothetical protein
MNDFLQRATRLLNEILEFGKGSMHERDPMDRVQGLLAFAFIAVGAMKVFAYEKYKALSEKNGPIET